jgi:hypothetical protein
VAATMLRTASAARRSRCALRQQQHSTRVQVCERLDESTGEADVSIVAGTWLPTSAASTSPSSHATPQPVAAPQTSRRRTSRRPWRAASWPGGPAPPPPTARAA